MPCFGFAPAFTIRLWFGGLSHSSCKFPCSFHFAVLLHSSCLVVVSYFMFIPVFVILLFQLLCSIFVLSGIKFLWQDLHACDKRVRHQISCQKKLSGVHKCQESERAWN